MIATTYPTKHQPVADNSHLDARDQEILAERLAAYEELGPTEPCNGDWVVFADGVTRRMSYIWAEHHDDGTRTPHHIQTSDPGGSWHLGKGYCSFSGSLYMGVPFETLTLTEERRPGWVWFFSHDWWTAHNGVSATVPFRVWICSKEAPKV